MNDFDASPACVASGRVDDDDAPDMFAAAASELGSLLQRASFVALTPQGDGFRLRLSADRVDRQQWHLMMARRGQPVTLRWPDRTLIGDCSLTAIGYGTDTKDRDSVALFVTGQIRDVSPGLPGRGEGDSD